MTYTVAIYDADGKCVDRSYQTDFENVANIRAQQKRDEYARLGWRITVKIETE